MKIRINQQFGTYNIYLEIFIFIFYHYSFQSETIIARQLNNIYI